MINHTTHSNQSRPKGGQLVGIEAIQQALRGTGCAQGPCDADMPDPVSKTRRSEPARTSVPEAQGVERFVKGMAATFRERGLVVTPKLKAMWAQVFEQLERIRLADDRALHRVVPAPTGTGKSTALVRYMSHHLPEGTGALVVAPFIEQIEQMAEAINTLCGEEERAVAYHSQSPFKGRLKALQGYPVLLITHQQYLRLLEQRKGQPEAFLRYRGKARMLVIDEWLDMRQVHSLSRTAVFWVKVMAEQMGLWSQGALDVDSASWPVLLKALRHLSVDEIERRVLDEPRKWLFWNTSTTRAAQQERLLSTLGLIRDLNNGTAQLITDRPDQQAQVELAWRLEPHRPALILDATAALEPQYEQGHYHIVPLPNPRSYERLTITLLEVEGDGKSLLSRVVSHPEDAEELVWQVYQRVEHRFAEPLFAVAHKDVRERLVLQESGVCFTWGHYGQLVGRNEFAHMRTGVFIGMPYVPQRLFEGLEVDARAAQYRRALAHLIQAINRLSIRRIVDEKGDCDRAHVYLVVKPTELLIETLKAHLPGCRIHREPFELPVRRPGNTPGPTSEAQQQLLAWLEKQPQGTQVSLSEALAVCQISRGAANGIRVHLQNPKSAFCQRLKHLGYEASRQSRKWVLKRTK